jgi:RNA polymerase sigma factor (sigma-70 family)
VTVAPVQDLRAGRANDRSLPIGDRVGHQPAPARVADAAITEAPVVGTVVEIGDLYVAFAARLVEIVSFNVRAPEAVIEDACQFAWTRMLHHRGRVRRDAVRAWLTRTATHQALKLVRREDRELSLDAILEPAGALARAGLTPALEDLIEQRGRLESIRGLPQRQQRLVWLHGLGFSYAEMARDCGYTERTVERQLLRGKRRLHSVGGA